MSATSFSSNRTRNAGDLNTTTPTQYGSFRSLQKFDMSKIKSNKDYTDIFNTNQNEEEEEEEDKRNVNQNNKDYSERRRSSHNGNHTPREALYNKEHHHRSKQYQTEEKKDQHRQHHHHRHHHHRHREGDNNEETDRNHRHHRHKQITDNDDTTKHRNRSKNIKETNDTDTTNLETELDLIGSIRMRRANRRNKHEKKTDDDTNNKQQQQQQQKDELTKKETTSKHLKDKPPPTTTTTSSKNNKTELKNKQSDERTKANLLNKSLHLDLGDLNSDNYETSTNDLRIKNEKSKSMKKKVKNKKEEDEDDEEEEDDAAACVSVGKKTTETEDDKISLSNASENFKLFFKKPLVETSFNFVLTPAPIGHTIHCKIVCRKSIFTEYLFYLEKGSNNGEDDLLLMTTRRRMNTPKTCYSIDIIEHNNSKVIEDNKLKIIQSNRRRVSVSVSDDNNNNNNNNNNIPTIGSSKTDRSNNSRRGSTSTSRTNKIKSGRIVSNMSRTKFNLELDSYSDKELLTIMFKTSHGEPRRINASANVCSPPQDSIQDINSSNSNLKESLINNKSKTSRSNSLCGPKITYFFKNRPPRYDEDRRKYVLDYSGRAKLSSKNNFQIIDSADPSAVLMLLGKVDSGTKKIDVSFNLIKLIVVILLKRFL
jgi:hypothetical protein